MPPMGELAELADSMAHRPIKKRARDEWKGSLRDNIAIWKSVTAVLESLDRRLELIVGPDRGHGRRTSEVDCGL